MFAMYIYGVEYHGVYEDGDQKNEFMWDEGVTAYTDYQGKWDEECQESGLFVDGYAEEQHY